MCYFTAYERFRVHIPLFTVAVLMIIASSIMICYGAAKEMKEVWITGVVIGSFATVTVVFAFFVVCVLFNPKSFYRRREDWKATATPYPPRLYNPYPRSVVSYPSAMHVQPPIMQMQAIPSPPLGKRSDGYQPVVAGSDVASSVPNSDAGYYKKPLPHDYLSSPTSDSTFDRNNGYNSQDSRQATMSPTVNVADSRRLI
jgi:hypothetical protein